MPKKQGFPWIAFIITIVLIFPLFYKLFPVVSQSGQIFHDLIIENVAGSGLNKTGELHLFWGLLALGIFLLCLLFIVCKKIAGLCPSIKRNLFSLPTFQNKRMEALRFLVILLVPNLFHYMIYQECNYALLFLSFVYLAACLIAPDSAALILSLYVLCYYAATGLCSVLLRLIPAFPVHLYLYGFGSATILTLVFGITKKTGQLKRALLLIQPAIVSLFAIYFVDEYLYQGELIKLPYAPGYYVFFGIVIAALFGFGIYYIKRYYKDAPSLNFSRLISVYTVMTIFVYNSFSACPMYAQPDQHHHGEQMIPWHQVVDMGRSLYEEYTPVSGLFPMVIGAIQHRLLGGSASDYSPAVSIFMVIVCMITMYLIYQHANGAWSLVFAVFFCLPCYNRQYLVLPLLLLLTLPKLREHRLLWLLFWIFGCFLAGLYYPLFGAAVLLGTLPLGLLQLSMLFKQPAPLKKPLNYIGILLVFVPIICSIPLLFKMLNHTLTYSSQTILADGICLFAQEVPEHFMPYLSGHAYLRNLLYSGLRFFLPLIGVWLFVCLILWILHAVKKTGVSFKKSITNPWVLSALSGGITLCISYTYTLVRADTGVILSRTSYILCAIVGIFLPLLLIAWQKKQVNDSDMQDFGKQFSFSALLLLACLIGLPMLLYRNVADVKTPAMWVYPNGESALFLDDEAKLYRYYEVPETFLKAEDTGLSETNLHKLGKGFIVADQLSYINHYQNVIEKCNAVKDDTTYMGFDGQGFYYFNDVKACSTGFIQAGKGYEAQQAIIERAKAERPVIFLMEPDCTYYVYYWMHTHDYVYCAADDCFYPSELFDAIYPDASPDDYREYSSGTDFGLVASSFGRSFDTLSDLMVDQLTLAPVKESVSETSASSEISASSETSASSEISASSETTENGIILFDSEGTFSGKDLDMLYLELNTSKLIEFSESAGLCAPSEITLHFYDKEGKTYDGAVITCSIGDGTLLIPAGMNPCWLLTEDIAKVTLSFNGQEDSTFYEDAVSDAILYKLRQ